VIEILCSAITGKIYAVKSDAKGHIKNKTDVTQQVINAVMQHMDVTKSEYECKAGELIFKPKATVSTESAQAKPEADNEF
jgi:hypothetical protein